MPRNKLGFGKPGVFTCTYSYKKHMFFSGDDMTVMVNCDNTQCDREVRNWKIRLHRKIVGVAHSKQGPMMFRKTEMIKE